MYRLKWPVGGGRGLGVNRSDGYGRFGRLGGGAGFGARAAQSALPQASRVAKSACGGHGGGSARARYVAAGGFSLIELLVVVAIVGALLLVMFPRFSGLVGDARQSEARQDAMLAGAAIELLKIEGRFDAGDAGLEEKIKAVAGKELDGLISSVDDSGSFVYSREFGGTIYTVSYNSLDGEYYDGAQNPVSNE
ncbi:MAG: type II secretion system GspH family protein [Clostridiales bacterium]|jgi:prepilin-type N-terminal cleavage/methylation domain-containing protein|nr:type II secretion system GspH family protein [Clostridiales bacterium]